MKGSTFYLCCLALLGVVYCQDPVLIDLYYESYCPYSRDFITNQLWPTYQLVPEIISARAFAYGNAQQTFEDNAWNFTCQHGPDECLGNLIDSCTFNYYPDQSAWIPFLGCAEDPNGDPNTAAQQCAIDNGMDWNLINTCVSSSTGNDLEHQAGVTTESLIPEQEYTPWIVINNVHDPRMESMAEYNLLSVVCGLYSGTKPAACSQATLTGVNPRMMSKRTYEN